MLDWLTTNQQIHYAEDSRLMEAPETPAPVFALRAFKSLFQESPDNDEHTQHLEKLDHSNSNNERRASNTQENLRHSVPNASPFKHPNEQSLGLVTRSPRRLDKTDSPMKSILLSSPRKVATPGTKKKNVSFREALHATQRGTRRNDVLDGLEKEGKAPSRKSTYLCDPSREKGKGDRDNNGNPRASEARTTLETHPVRSSKGEKEHKPKSFKQEMEQNLLQHIYPKSSTKASSTDINQEGSSKPATPQPSSDDAAVPSPDRTADYISRTNREVKKLVRTIQTTRSYARKKDQEASQLLIKLTKQSAENRKLHVENQELKKRLKALEAEVPQGCERPLDGKETKIDSKRINGKRETDTESCEVIHKTTAPLTSSPAFENVPHLTGVGILKPTQAEESSGGNPRVSLSSANGRVRIAPDRLEAAKARLRVKSEERRKAWGSPTAEKEND